MHKRNHILSKLLSWLLISAQILALISTATVGAIQPTPQIAQAVAQQVGFSDWFAARTSELTAWAQPLWGTPQRARAAPIAALSDLSGNVTTPWVQSTFQVSATTARTPDFLCTGLTCPTITNPNNTTDSTTTNYAAISFPVLAVFASASIRITESDDDYPAGTFAGFKIAKVGGLLDLSLFDNLTIRTYLNGTQKETKSGTSIIDGSLLGLIGSGSVSEYVVGFWTTQAFDAVEIYQAQPIGLNLGGETRIFHAVLEKAADGPALTCNAGIGTNWLKPLYPVRLNDAATGITGICAGCSVDGASNIIDSNTTNYANINVGIGLAGGGQIAVYDPLITSYPAGTFAGFVVEDTGGLGASLLDAFVLETYLDGAQQQSIAAGSLIDFPFFSGKKTIGFTTSQAFDEVRIRAVSLASLNVNLRVYQALLAPAGCTMTGPRGPGGVTDNLAAWYKADGTVGATQWDDESGNGKHMLAAGDGTAARMPTVEAAPGAVNNFNPRVAFLSNADGNRKWTMTASGNNVFPNTSTPGTIFNVSNFPDETVYDVPQMYAFEDDDPGLNLFTDRNAANDIRVVFQRDNGGTGSAGWDFVVPGVSQTQPLLTAHAWNYAAGGNTFSFNGYDYTPSSNPFIGATSPRYMFGSELTVAAGEAHSGYTSENIVYSTNWPSNSDERKRINSYLAIKYGITLLGSGTLGGGAADATFGGTADYLNSASTIIWNGTTSNSSYHNNVAGIGRDDASALQQKQSTSANSDFQPIIGLGTIAASNAANSNTFSADRSFVVWGDNGQAASFGVSYSPTSFSPVAGYFRMARVWKVQETGTVGTVVVQGAGADHLLVSSDPTFATGVTEIDMGSGSAPVDFSNGQFFTFGTNATAPGGVGSGLESWVKADAGISASDGAAVATWTDQSLGGYDFTQATTGAQPTYYSTTVDKLLNFNPVLDFDGTGDYLRNTNVLMPSASPYTFLAVGVDEDTGTGYRKLFGSEAIVDYFGLYKQGGATGDNGWIPYAVGGQARSTPFIGDRGSMGKGTKYSADGGANGYWNGTNFTSDSRTDYAQPQIVGFNSLNSATSDPFYTWTDGYKEDPNWSPIVDGLVFRNQFFSQTSIGADVTVELWKGRIPEFMAYSQSLSDADIAKINTYLAIKYGITLGQGNSHVGKNGNNYNYVATDGTVIWDASANSTYAYNIAGIGRDDAEALTQKQSKSIQTGFQPVIGLGAIAATNAANNHTFAVNKSYLVWGDNGQTASFGTAYSPTTFTPAAGYFRMSRIWKVQETGTITNVVVQADADHLIVSSDPTFASGVTEIAFNSGSATVDFANGQFFTFGKAITAPGAVVNELVFWSKADDAGCTPGDACADWDDRSLSGNPIETIGAMTLQAADAAHNFHPYFSSFSTVNYFKDVNSSFATPWPPIDVTEVSVFAVARANSLTDDGRITGMDNDDNLAGEPGLSIVDGSPAFYRFSSGPGRVTLSDDVVVNTSAIFSARTAGTQLTVGLNGKHTASAITAGGGFAGDIFNIGYGTWDINGPFPGDIQEVIWYRTDVSNTERQRIESYLALKYGITLDQSTAQNYLAGDGTTVVWDATAHAAYSNNIAGIGRDDASALNQKQATSTNPGFQPAIGLGTIAASNGANSNTFGTNKTFMLWGSNNQTASFGVSYTPTSFTPAGGYYRMARVWKVQETGTITNVVVQGTGADRLLISNDPTFASGVTEIAFSSGSATVDFTNGQYFTFGRELTAPGGVASPVVWLRADSGTNTTTDGAAVNSWVNNGSSGGTAGQLGTCTFPTFTENKHNFNPAILDTTTNCNGALLLTNVFPTYSHHDLATFVVRSQPDVTQQRSILAYNNNTAVGPMDEAPWLASQAANQSWFWWAGNYAQIGTFPVAASRVNDRPEINGLSLPMWSSGTHVTTLYLNGTSTTVSGGVNGSLGIGRNLFINQDSNGDNSSGGSTSEIVAYDRILSATELQRVNSYLAIKYGLTYLNGAGSAVPDYLAADASTIWNATTNSAYNNNIAGIGRDDAADLEQKQSQSVNSGFQVAMGLGGIAATTAANSNSFSANKSFLLWGSDTAATTLTASYNGGSNNRVARVWKVQETGTVGAVKVVIPRSAFPGVGLRSLIVHASDPAFGTVDRTYPLVTSGGNYEVTVDFTNGDFFSFSSSLTVPEINVTPGTLDFGEMNTGMVSPAQAVTIQNQGDVSLSLSNISLSGADAARFAISSNNCGASLSAGASCTVQITFSPTTSGSRSALLVITSNDSNESTVNVALSGTTPGSSGGGTPGTYNLAVTKSASTANATVGVPFTYTITVLNKGTIAASNVTMTDQLPAGVTFGVANATGGGNCNHSSGTVTCTWASLAGGASATVTISVTP